MTPGYNPSTALFEIHATDGRGTFILTHQGWMNAASGVDFPHVLIKSERAALFAAKDLPLGPYKQIKPVLVGHVR
jgi:hypothetical protein